MSWKETNAVKRIYNAFKRSKDKIYSEDVEALKIVNETIENNTKLMVNDNLLYAKLLCTHLRLCVSHYGNIKTAIRKANNELQMTLPAQIELLKIALNNADLESYLKSINFDTLKQELTNADEFKGHEKELIEKLKTNWSFENVEKSFYNTANTFLKDIDNYK